MRRGGRIVESGEQACLWRCTHLRQGRCLCTGRLVLQMCENFVDDGLVLDRGNDPGLAAADPASLYIDAWAAPLKTRLSLCAQVMAT